jgi:hypothetical protein
VLETAAAASLSRKVLSSSDKLERVQVQFYPSPVTGQDSLLRSLDLVTSLGSERTTYKLPCTLLKEAVEFACPVAPEPASNRLPSLGSVLYAVPIKIYPEGFALIL